MFTILHPSGLDAGMAVGSGKERLRAHHEALEGELGS